MPVVPEDDTDFFFEDNAVFIAGKGGWKLGERDPEEREDPRDREFLDSYIGKYNILCLYHGLPISCVCKYHILSYECFVI